MVLAGDEIWKLRRHIEDPIVTKRQLLKTPGSNNGNRKVFPSSLKDLPSKAIMAPEHPGDEQLVQDEIL